MKDLTYAESQGTKPFDWTLFLDRAISGQVSEDEEEDAMIFSKKWVTCACGNQCSIIPRTQFGAPLDFYLNEKGSLFYHAIRAMAYREAKQILILIEERAAKLVSEIEKEAAND